MNHLDSCRRAEGGRGSGGGGGGGHIVGHGGLLCGAASLAAVGPTEVNVRMAREKKEDATESEPGREAEENQLWH